MKKKSSYNLPYKNNKGVAIDPICNNIDWAGYIVSPLCPRS